jgi:hypothetical protein
LKNNHFVVRVVTYRPAVVGGGHEDRGKCSRRGAGNLLPGAHPADRDLH